MSAQTIYPDTLPRFADTSKITLDKILQSLNAGGGGGGGGAPTNATYITKTPNATLSAEQALSALATGILKSATGTGVVSVAAASDVTTLVDFKLLSGAVDPAADPGVTNALYYNTVSGTLFQWNDGGGVWQ